ncbi:flavin reductase family protein [Brumimicrobium oceani]|uniref:Flavin oxidoreductase n=1 Tax=Brumimicrobium oceani TaxID=2100725 RepID=A0A2U2XBF6_9FLAO|nr:flavin reductase [Brumimicrobium oceani]PWH85118.1 flavin oxidoreductase [Brumimicrobium oceani]
MLLEEKTIKILDRVYRLNLINSITGVKPANLIGTRSKKGEDNVAIFSSVVHLGSQPAQIGFIVRPAGENPRDTLQNINETGYYTINHISASFIQKAHYTSANLDIAESEFERMNIAQEMIADFHAPFVKESAVKIGLKHVDNILLPNGCTLVIGEVVLIEVPEESIDDIGQIDLEKYECAALSGLGTYYHLNKITSYPHVKTNEIPDFE